MRHPSIHPVPPTRSHRPRRLRRSQRLGKYKILRRLGEGGFAEVYAAIDTIEAAQVALKIPHADLVSSGVLRDFYREVRLAARLEHPNILRLKNADFIGERFVAVSPLGLETLENRLKRRLATAKALSYAEQAISAAAFAHAHGIMHCDIKPENFILFSGDVLRLTDFGIAKVSLNTVQASGSGTIGYLAPEQAMGKPSPRSDVFSLGLVIYRMLSGELPEWPFEWPLRGHTRIRARAGKPMVDLLAKALQINPRRRFADAGKMLEAFRSAKRRATQAAGAKPRRRTTPKTPTWKALRQREFSRHLGRELQAKHPCRRCKGPVSEEMAFCPWCGVERKKHLGDVGFPTQCPRCHRGMKLDWRFCPWCYGPGFEVSGKRAYSDRRYSARCANPACSRRKLMPFMRYCPWCRTKVRRPWKIKALKKTCKRCKWAVAADYWRYCAWCRRTIEK